MLAGFTVPMPTPVPTPYPTEVLLFRAGGQFLTLSLGLVREIVPLCALSCPPGMPAVLQGLLDLGGESLPVLRLTRLLGLPDDPPRLHSPLVLVRVPDRPFAFQAEAVCRVDRPAPDDWRTVPPGQVFNGCVTAELRRADGVVYLLDPTRLLLRREREAVMEFADRENRRERELAGAQPV